MEAQVDIDCHLEKMDEEANLGTLGSKHETPFQLW